LRNNRIVFLAVAISTAACASSSPHMVPRARTVSGDVRDVLKNQFPDVAPATIDRLTEIEGFNDEQALSGDGSDDTGPVASLYIVPKRYDDAEFIDTWRLTSILEVGAGTMPKAYKDILKVKDNSVSAQYCVYLKKKSAGNNWEASVAPVAAKRCLNADDGEKINQVAEELEPSTSKSDFPSVVRFDQDQNGKVVSELRENGVVRDRPIRQSPRPDPQLAPRSDQEAQDQALARRAGSHRRQGAPLQARGASECDP
jgi:hypothetical protein